MEKIISFPEIKPGEKGTVHSQAEVFLFLFFLQGCAEVSHFSCVYIWWHNLPLGLKGALHWPVSDRDTAGGDSALINYVESEPADVRPAGPAHDTGHLWWCDKTCTTCRKGDITDKTRDSYTLAHFCWTRQYACILALKWWVTSKEMNQQLQPFLVIPYSWDTVIVFPLQPFRRDWEDYQHS